MKSPTDTQLNWMRAIHKYWVTTNGLHPGLDDLLHLLSLSPGGTNGAMEVIERLEKQDLVEWPFAEKFGRRVKGGRLSRRANSVRLTPRGLEVLMENS